MKTGNAIWWEANGERVEGIVKEVKPGRLGVLAVKREDYIKHGWAAPIVFVADPHKVAAVKVDDDLFAAFLKEIENPSVTDRLRLNGMGIKVSDLPKPSADAMPINKMYF